MKTEAPLHTHNAIPGGKIDRIQVDYCRTTREYPETAEEREAWESFTWRYFEHLTIDRLTGTIELVQEPYPGCPITHKYQLKDQVRALLDQFSEEGLFSDRYPQTETGVEEPDQKEKETLAENPDRSIDYAITIRYRGGADRRLAGSYDASGLPADYAGFMEPVFALLENYGFGEMIFPAVYGKIRRKKGELIYCSVVFEGGGKSYYYRTEDDTLEKGTIVVVPAGKDNRPAIATIIRVEYVSPAAVPFPLEQTKQILRRCTKEDYLLLGGQ